MKLLITLISLILLCVPVCFSQRSGDMSSPINECYGAVNIIENGDYNLQFTGNSGEKIDKAYPSLFGKISENQIWCSYLASEDGELNLDATVENTFLKMIIFRQEMSDLCGEMASGMAEIQRLQIKDSLKQLGLSKSGGRGMMYSLELKKGDKIAVVFFTEGKSREMMKLNWNFNSFQQQEAETKLVDLRNDDFAPIFRILIRDKETKLPLIGNITIEGYKTLAALYIGSDIYFNLERRCQLMLQCNVEGYFYRDVEVKIESLESMDIVLEMERVGKGKKMLIEEIEFVPGTSDIHKNSEPKLSRLRDFLALNADIHIEIQGHVHHEGDNNFAAQRMSEARAKRVMKFLIDNGIDKHRLSAVGFGNTQPVFEDPRFSYEEQANRRVEIMIK